MFLPLFRESVNREVSPEGKYCISSTPKTIKGVSAMLGRDIIIFQGIILMHGKQDFQRMKK